MPVLTELNVAVLISGILSFLGVLLSFVYQSRTCRIEILKEQLLKVYLPMFTLIEKDINKDVNKEDARYYIEKLELIINDNYHLINSDIIYGVRQLRYLLENDKDYQECFTDTVFLIARNFDFIRRKLKYPARSIMYKLNNNQIDTRLTKSALKAVSQYFYELWEDLKPMLIMLLAALVLMFTYMLAQSVLP